MGRHKGSYRYADVELALPETAVVERPPLKLEGTGDGARLRLPCRREELEKAVAELLAEVQWLEALSSDAERPVAAEAQREASLTPPGTHGVFDVERANERQVWVHGKLDRVIARSRLPRHKPFGTYPDLEWHRG